MNYTNQIRNAQVSRKLNVFAQSHLEDEKEISLILVHYSSYLSHRPKLFWYRITYFPKRCVSLEREDSDHLMEGVSLYNNKQVLHATGIGFCIANVVY